MKVNFNNVRRNALREYDQLVKKLNAAIIKNEDQYAVPNDVYHDQPLNLKGYVLIDAEDLEEVINDLRTSLGTIAMTYEEGSDEFKDVFEEMYPESVGASMAIFNDKEES